MRSRIVPQFRPALVLLLVLSGITGVAYPLLVTGVAHVVFADRANGSLLERDGVVVGSSVIGQAFVDDQTGATIPGYFRGRPSNAGYDASNSGGSNLGPTNPLLIDSVQQQVAIVRAENGLSDDQAVPVDLVTSSASGLDPHISPAAAALQIPRVARERGVSEEAVEELVDRFTSGRTLGILGEPRVDVLQLNLALDDRYPMAP